MQIKTLKKIIFTIFLLCFTLITTFSVAAAENPYPTSQTISGVKTVPCTWYAWQQAYDNTGVAMPNWGNAGNWYSRASAAGYSVGSVAKPKSIAVWSGGTYGHVSYVVSVNGSKMTVNEGGMYNSSGGAYNGTGILNGNTVNSTVGQQKGNGSSKVLVGFIYLTESVSDTVKIAAQASKNEISSNNAILWGKVDKPSSYAVTKIGIKVRVDGGTYANGWSRYDTPSSTYVGRTDMYPYYDLKAELRFTPTHATKYYYQFYAVVNGKEYWSDEFNITTSGSHSYPSTWTTTKSATCTESGSAKRSCSCGKTETKTLSALGHNYSSSWTTDTAASCTTTGSKSYHCTRCSAKSQVTTIAALGHKWSNWSIIKQSTCTSYGTQERTCGICSAKDFQNINPKGHTYSEAYTIDSAATCIVAGTKSKHCQNCSSKTSVTTINPTGHNWSEFTVINAATTETQGTSQRKCLNNGCSVTESRSIPKLAADGHTHTFGNWYISKTATCTENGEQQRNCTICNEAETQTISASGHNFSEWSSADENGIINRSCINCGTLEKQTAVIIPEENPSTDAPVTEQTSTLENTEIRKKSNNLPYIVVGIILLLGGAGTAGFVILKKKKFFRKTYED